MLSVQDVVAAVQRVLTGEGKLAADISITFLSSQQMRALNRATFQRDRATDVIAFPLDHPERQVGDIYVCPSLAKASARAEKVPRREEEFRLVIHGVLHVCGYKHPPGSRRLTSEMWAVQERYVTALTKQGAARR